LSNNKTSMCCSCYPPAHLVAVTRCSCWSERRVLLPDSFICRAHCQTERTPQYAVIQQGCHSWYPEKRPLPCSRWLHHPLPACIPGWRCEMSSVPWACASISRWLDWCSKLQIQDACVWGTIAQKI
jgi:hypothetical protein